MSLGCKALLCEGSNKLQQQVLLTLTAPSNAMHNNTATRASESVQANHRPIPGEAVDVALIAEIIEMFGCSDTTEGKHSIYCAVFFFLSWSPGRERAPRNKPGRWRTTHHAVFSLRHAETDHCCGQRTIWYHCLTVTQNWVLTRCNGPLGARYKV